MPNPHRIPPRRRRTRTASIAALLLAGLALTGCSSSGLEHLTGDTEGNTMDARQELLARPTYGEAETTYLALLTDVRTALAAADPNVTWPDTKPYRDGESLCTEPFDSFLDVRSAGYTTAVGQGGLSADQWEDTQKAIKTAAAPYGFTEVALENHAEGQNLLLVLAGPADDTLEIGSGINTTIDIYGGCYLISKDPTPTASPNA